MTTRTRRPRPPRLRPRADRGRAGARRQLLVRPGAARGQRRALHRRRAGADRSRRAAAGQRRARPGRVLRPAGDRRGHARRELQPRHEAAPRGGRRHDHGDGRRDAARARRSSSRAPARRATSASGSTENFDEIKRGGRDHDQLGPAARHRAVLGRADPLHPLQLHDRRRRRPEPDRQGHRRRVRVDPRQLPGRSSTSSSSRTSRPTRRARRSTCCARAASGWSPRRRSRTSSVERIMRSSTELMFRARQVSNLGGFMSGVNNNGAHSANGITAMFIATGQDAANVAESSAAFVYAELRPNGDYYYSVTIPSLIVATYGGGTGLADPARVPRAARLLRQGQGPQARRDRRRDGALRRALARLGDRRRGVGRRPRPLRAQPPVGESVTPKAL